MTWPAHGKILSDGSVMWPDVTYCNHPGVEYFPTAAKSLLFPHE